MLTGTNSRNGAQPPVTLGARLHADQTGVRVPESDWAELIGAIAWRNQAALRTLYDRSRWLVFTLALRITGKPEEAEAVTLDVFQGIWQRAGEYDPASGSVVSWIMSLARARSLEALSEQPPTRIDPQLDPKLQAMARMSTLELQAITSFSDLSYSEVAQQFGEPIGSVGWRIRSGLVRLRRTLKGDREAG
jgi:RNA polymerase sigma-70 factor, ECF subfamily